MRHLISLADLKPAEIERIFAITKDLKEKHAAGLREPLLPGRAMALLFEKPSLRTRVSFEAAMLHLGGDSLFLGGDVGWGARESIAGEASVATTRWPASTRWRVSRPLPQPSSRTSPRRARIGSRSARIPGAQASAWKPNPR